MGKFQCFLTFCISMLLLFGCSNVTKEVIPDEEDNSVQPRIEGLLKTTLEAVLEDKKLMINFSLRNISNKDLKISFGSGQQYDIFVYNVQNEEVFTWSNNYSFTQALIERDIKKGDSLVYTENWDLKDNGGNPISKGVYTIKVLIMGHVTIGEGRVNPEELIAESTIELFAPS